MTPVCRKRGIHVVHLQRQFAACLTPSCWSSPVHKACLHTSRYSQTVCEKHGANHGLRGLLTRHSWGRETSRRPPWMLLVLLPRDKGLVEGKIIKIRIKVKSRAVRESKKRDGKSVDRMVQWMRLSRASTEKMVLTCNQNE